MLLSHAEETLGRTRRSDFLFQTCQLSRGTLLLHLSFCSIRSTKPHSCLAESCTILQRPAPRLQGSHVIEFFKLPGSDACRETRAVLYLMFYFFWQATGRLRKNAHYFKVNYLIVMLSVTFITLVLNPTSLIALAFLAMAWVYLFVVRQAPIVIGGRTFRSAQHPSGTSKWTLRVFSPWPVMWQLQMYYIKSAVSSCCEKLALSWRCACAQRTGKVHRHFHHHPHCHLLPDKVRSTFPAPNGSSLVF